MFGPGDILIANDAFSHPGPGSVLLVDPVSGEISTLASGGLLLQRPRDVVIDRSGDLIVADDGSGSLIRVSAEDGTQSNHFCFACEDPGGFAFGPRRLAIDAEGSILVGGSLPAGAELRRIDRNTGTQSTLTSIPRDFGGIAVDEQGDIWVSEDGFLADTFGSLREYDATSGEEITVLTGSPGGVVTQPHDVVALAGGDLLVANFAELTIVRPDDVSSEFVSATAADQVALEQDGSILALNCDHLGRVDPLTGAASTVTSGLPFCDTGGIAVVPVPEPSEGMLLLAGVLALVGTHCRR
jgi:streptogramin lyase